MLKKIYKKDGSDRLLPKFSLFIFDRSRTAALLWLCLTIFGIFSYTTFLKREGFPSVNIPFSVVSGAYLVNDAAKVDKEVAKPISDIIMKDDRVKTVQTNSQDMFFSVVVQYKSEDTDATKVGKELEKRIEDANVLPEQVTLKMETPKFGFTERGDDGVVSVYSRQKAVPQDQLVAEAERVAQHIESKNLESYGLESVSVISPFVDGIDPATGQPAKTQTKFDRYGVRENGKNNFYESASVGFQQKDGTDVIKLNEKIEEAVAEYNRQNTHPEYKAVVSATYAHDIEDQIGELQKSLLEGLLAVLVIGSIVIAIRASIITVISMLTVLAITLGVLLTVGYSLNTITLFSLVLCLGLIVDDTIIMVEALDAQRRRRKDAREVVKVATQKVSRAMVAATLTACLSFAPLLFVGGILGNFIRAIPVTMISALLTSLLVALVFIPLFARYLLLGKKQLGSKNVHEPAAAVEAKVAAFVGKPMLWARNSKKKLIAVGLTAVLIGFAFIATAMFMFSKVTFNIFPPSKDSNGLIVNMQFEPGTTIAEAERLADQANLVLADKLGENFESAAYYTNASDQTTMLTLHLIPYSKRDVRAPELEKQLDKQFAGFDGARVEVSQLDVGPPAANFSVRIESEDREAAYKMAQDMSDFLLKAELKRPSGEIAKVKDVTVSDPGIFSRDDSHLYLGVTARFNDTDTTTLVTLAQQAVEKEFNAKKIASYGLDKDVLKFDFGQEEENQESFATLLIAFPLLLVAIYVLLAVQFRSLAQPLLIFMAIPFSLFGITMGLYFTDNAFSFFAMLGFFALVGLSIKNTILLTDYANQLRRSGEAAVDAAVGALAERFRPLIATSLTAVVSLIPLALTSPFWEGLTVVLIFGLLSSTFLVITVFPYYYLGTEYLRLHISRVACLSWLGLSGLASFGLVKAGAASMIPLAIIALAVATGIVVRRHRRHKAAQ